MSLDLFELNLVSDLYTFDYFKQDDVCRFCWKREALSKLIEITERSIKNNIMDIIECLDIDFTRCAFPKKICSECFVQIDKFHNFKRFCQESDRKLRKIISDHELGIENGSGTVKIEKDCNFDGYLECLKGSDSDSELATIRNKSKKKVSKHTAKRTATYCNICRIDFEKADKFDSHNSISHGIEKGGGFRCFGCERLFKNRKSRLGHEVNFCRGLKDGYKCGLCENYLPKRGMYEAHIRDHKNNVMVNLPEDIFKCSKCNLSYKTKQLLKDHMFEHKQDGKKYVCEDCGRVFTRNDYLLKHKLTHTGEKQHKCPHCSYRATQRSSLIVHIRKHTGERPYRCTICPQQCISSSNLRAHQQRHLKIKRHECEICNKKFGYKVSLQEHMSTHAPAQSHACEQCSTSYSRLRALKRHIIAKHPEIKPE